MKILTRSEWGAVAAKGCTTQNPGSLDGVVVHWFGTPKAASAHAGCDDLLRSVQRTHMAPGGLGTTSGALDIAYSHAVCPHGVAYELRGFGCRTGANGNTDANRRYGAVVYMAGTGDPLTSAGADALGRMVRRWLSKTGGNQVLKHGTITGSTCPGPAVGAWVDRKGWKLPPWKVVKEGHIYAQGTLAQVTRWVRGHAAKVKGLGGVNIRPRR